MESDSVLIDITHVKGRALLNKAMLKFNKDSENGGFYEDFFGCRKQTLNYLGHDFLETKWLFHGKGRRPLIEDDLTLEDGTIVKGFPSYIADATIVSLKLENLPFLPQMAECLSCFGEPLSRVIIWDPRVDEQRKVFLQCDKMPDFCRNFQSTKHCRADCPDYKKWIRCFHCNETGHVMRNGFIESAPAKVRVISNPGSLPKPRKVSKEPVASYIGSSPRSEEEVVTARTSTQMAVPPPHPQAIAASDKAELDNDADMIDSGYSATTNDTDTLKYISHDADMQYTGVSTPRSPNLDSNKAARTDGSTDISMPPNFSQLASSLWNQHCRIVSLSSKYTINHIADGIDNGRFIPASLTLTHDEADSLTKSPIATILNLYGRSDLPSARSVFYSSELLSIPIFKNTITNTNINNTILIMEDFNYQYKDRRLDGSLFGAPTEWTDLLDDYYIDVFGEDKQDTWHSGRSSGILDYIFCSSNAHHLITSSDQHYMSPKWTDQELLGCSFQYTDTSRLGPGSWKANPFLARNKDFWRALAHHLESNMEQFNAIKTFSSPQQQWDWIKGDVKIFIKGFQREDLNWRKNQLHKLLAKRNASMRHSKHRGLVFQGLDWINDQIASLQQPIAEIEILKSRKYWRENEQKSTGFLKRTVAARENKRTIRELRDPNTETLCQDQYSECPR
ncbi:hypothetical protein [Parasitella parasitica]|uniref:Endonuclease/exonuclease/phosphatase domain-containing protein n=1 Tax=Parasitella parasitica TaxID=35722 RepID=A0A0B7NH20_9FUNG|nr:hypothetical protein [Parasitella parasitica]